jgi:hypothetical protein
MKLIFIYGPPAVGKMTIGRILAEYTGYRFFFNHLTVPAAKALFPGASSVHEVESYYNLLKRLRIEGIKAAVEAGLDVIFTVAYSGQTDDEFVAEIKEIVMSGGGEVCFVQLSAPDSILMERVANTSRSELHLGKMTNPDHLQAALVSRDMRASVPYASILKMNTNELTAKQAAEHIAARFHLPRK